MIVVDASVLADALLDDGAVGQHARAVLSEDTHWVAPAHVLVEVLSVVRGRVLGGKLGIERGDEAVSAMTELAIEVIDPATVVERMWELRDNVTAYDAAYLAVAEVIDAPLVTGDARLARVTGVKCAVRLVP
ncbi:MAG: type II toxin-antitoxin system VapC family toxin [Pseudonocardiaceae bacterium]